VAFVVDRIDHVVLNCRDVDATIDWYVRVLGMRREVFGDNRTALVFGSQKINVRPTGATGSTATTRTGWWPTRSAVHPPRLR